MRHPEHSSTTSATHSAACSGTGVSLQNVLRFLSQRPQPFFSLESLFLLMLFLLLSICFTEPNPYTINETLPVGLRRLPTVPLFNLWTMWWNAESALQGFSNYWDAPIFFPERGTFAFSEPQPATLAVAPLIWGGSRIFAYKLYLWAALTLNGFVTSVSLARLGHARWTAWTGGLCMLCLPIVYHQIEVIQLVSVWGIVWTCTNLILLTEPKANAMAWQRGLECGAAFSCVAYTCLHHALFLAVLLCCSVPVLVRNWRDVRKLCGLLIASLVVILLVGPLVFPLRQELKRRQFERPVDVVAKLSLRPRQYLVQPETALLQRRPAAFHRDSASPGWMKSAFAMLGAVLLLRRPLQRRRGLFWLLFGTAAVLLSLGSNLVLGSWQPWETLTHWVPGFSQVRSAYRFAYFAQISIVWLAMEGLRQTELWRRCRASHWGLKRIFASAVALGMGAVFCIIEVPPRIPQHVRIVDVSRHRQWIDFVRKENTPGHAVACFPFASGRRERDFEVTVNWMYFATWHKQPLVNGYSGFFPESYSRLKRAINEDFPTDALLTQLQRAGVELLIVDTRYVRENLSSYDSPTHKLELIYEDNSPIQIYHLLPLQPVSHLLR